MIWVLLLDHIVTALQVLGRCTAPPCFIFVLPDSEGRVVLELIDEATQPSLRRLIAGWKSRALPQIHHAIDSVLLGPIESIMLRSDELDVPIRGLRYAEEQNASLA